MTTRLRPTMDGLEMLHHCDIAVRKALVYAELARDNLAEDARGHRTDALRRLLADAEQYLQLLVASVEGDIGARGA
jgi:hypothetical protein